MDIHEYQAKQVLRDYGVPVPNGLVIHFVDEVDLAIKNLASNVIVAKAQIHAGGRGKAGGVKVAKTTAEVKEFINRILGSKLVTNQTGPEGQVVRKIYLEEGSNIAREYYLGLVVNREKNMVEIIFSTEGGIDIEEVAERSPRKITSCVINPLSGCEDFYIRKLCFDLGLDAVKIRKISEIVKKTYKAFIEKDASQIEINPLVEDESGNFIALDAKINFDDNALYRHPDIREFYDYEEEVPEEIEASKYGLSYIKMDGNIGCMVNGAGLAMATMDIIKYYGAEPANFLDVGGGASKETVTEAFKIILSDKKVSAILVNIFGGIMRCDIIAHGIISGACEVGINVPLVVRLSGTNFELGKDILKKSGLDIIVVDDLEQAAKAVVNVING